MRFKSIHLPFHALYAAAFVIAAFLPASSAATQAQISSYKVITSSGVGGSSMITIDPNATPGGPEECSVNGKNFTIDPIKKTQGNYLNCQFYPYGSLVDTSVCSIDQSATIALCGTTLTLSPSQITETQLRGLSFHLPAPYEDQVFVLQCVSTTKGFKWIVDSSETSCVPAQCPDATLPICGKELTIPGGTNAGQRTQIAVPAGWLSPYAQGFSHAVISQCDIKDGHPSYQFVNTDFVGCNDFTCPDTSVTFCGQEIPIQGGTAVGTAYTATMPAPFAPDQVKIQCIGNDAEPPTYHVDGSAVTCSRMNDATPR